MALNFPGPYIIKLFYTTTVSSVALSHQQTISLDLVSEPLPGAAFSTIETILPSGSVADPTLDGIINDWVADMRAFISSGGGNTIDRAELWKVVPDSFDASFLSAYTIALAGTSGSAINAAAQSIVTMRTTAGGVFKLSFMETVIAPAVTDSGTISNVNLEAIVADIEAKRYPWIGRDNGYPFVRIAHYPGSNEKLWKKRFRQL